MEGKQYQDVLSLLTDEKFQLWLKGQGDETLNQKWQEWINKSPKNFKLFQEAVKTWESTSYQSSQLPNIDEEWNKLQRRLSFTNEQKTRSHSQNIPFYQKSNASKSWIGYATTAAAVILLALIFWTQDKFHLFNPGSDTITISTAFGERKTIDLPDNSSVIINANSTLSYPINWNNASNHIIELKGEAYFSTSKPSQNSQHNFIVSTADGIIEVVGTRFNVYKRNHSTRVALIEGRVKIHPQKSERIEREYLNPTFISPGEMAYFQKGKQQVEKKAGIIKSYTSWWKNAIVFDSTPFREIITRLEDTYGVQIQVSNKKLLSRKISGSIENSTFEVIIEALAHVLQVPVHQNKQKIIFGEYTSS